MIDLEIAATHTADVCKQRGWKKDWSNGGCYLHLEVSEFIESLRGKGGVPEEEAADVIICLLAMVGSNGLDGHKIEEHIIDKIAAIGNGTLGVKVDYETNCADT